MQYTHSQQNIQALTWLLFSSAALFVLLATSARAWIIWIKPFSLPVFSECVMRCHLCLFRSPVPPALFLPSARSGYGIRYGSSSLRWNWSSRRTYRIPSSYILPVDLSVRMPADRFPDGADPYHRCDPSSVYRLPLTVPLAPSHAAALLPGILLLSPRMLLQHALSMYA